MADVGGMRTRIDLGVEREETPALVCGSCRGETSLASLRADPEVPRCRHCGHRFPGFRTVASSESELLRTVRALIQALDAGDLPGAATLVCAGVIWQEAPDGPGAVGREAVVDLWRHSTVSRSVGELEVHDDVVVCLVLERDFVREDQRVVRWIVGFEGDRIRSCWVWNVGGDDGPGRSGG